jgi:hypothetical protein
MKTVIGAFLALLLVGSSVSAGDRSLPPAEDQALAQFTRAAGDAEAAYRETVLGLLKVLGSHLVDAERATVRKGDIEEANRIRYYRDRLARLATEVSRHDFLGGLVPVIDKQFVPPSAKAGIEACAGKLSEADGVYRAALKTARSGISELIASARRLATDSADLDAVNRVRKIEDAIDHEIAIRLERLGYIERRFDSRQAADKALLLEQPEAWRVEDGELIGTEGPGEKLAASVKLRTGRISAVTVRGRILPSAKHNFRMAVGPVTLIFNWERAAECHFRYHEKLTVVRGNLLVPGREHQITVRQLTKKSIEVLVDGRRVWITHGRLSGTITVYTHESSIGIREVRVLGTSGGLDLDPRSFKPSHRRW